MQSVRCSTPPETDAAISRHTGTLNAAEAIARSARFRKRRSPKNRSLKTDYQRVSLVRPQPLKHHRQGIEHMDDPADIYHRE